MALEALFHQLIVYLNYLATSLLHVIILVHCFDFHQLCVLKGFFEIHFCENAYYDGCIDRHGFSLVCVFKWFVIFHLRESLCHNGCIDMAVPQYVFSDIDKKTFSLRKFHYNGYIDKVSPHVRSYMVCRKYILREHLVTIAVP
ncbi:unnamed protein product [Meganyctiphanes norvegica]|uniref:Uncharacterized protein n=1 Tax=Meganyctiphanes norvegica TaxID=48144 RepID=A0AAV2SKH7_MEGNR